MTGSGRWAFDRSRSARSSAAPSTRGITQSISSRSNGRPARSAASIFSSAVSPSSAQSTPSACSPPTPSACSRSDNASRASGWSSTTSTRIAAACGSGGDGGAGGDVSGKRAVNWNTEPCPGSLSIQIRPPINSTSFFAIVRPSPVPP